MKMGSTQPNLIKVIYQCNVTQGTVVNMRFNRGTQGGQPNFWVDEGASLYIYGGQGTTSPWEVTLLDHGASIINSVSQTTVGVYFRLAGERGYIPFYPSISPYTFMWISSRLGDKYYLIRYY